MKIYQLLDKGQKAETLQLSEIKEKSKKFQKFYFSELQPLVKILTTQIMTYLTTSPVVILQQLVSDNNKWNQSVDGQIIGMTP